MTGILKLAYKLLVNDKAKFTALLVGITFAVFLMIAMTSLFAGVLNRASATVINLGASMWIMDPSVQTEANTIGMPDYVLDAVRSTQGVNYAVPVYSGGDLVKLADGGYQAVTVEVRYDAGLDPYLNVISAQAVLLNDQETAVNFRMQRMLASVQLIKALGGGWDASQIPSPKELGAKH